MAEAIIYGNPLSTYTRTARMAFEEKGAPYRLEPVDHRAADFRAIHPFGKIPALRHGDFVLWETLAICAYCDSAFDGPPLQPADVRARAVMLQWISATIDYFYATMIRKLVFERLVAPMRGKAVDEALIAAALPEIETQARILDRTLAETPHLAGAAATIADLFLYPVLFYVARTPDGQQILDRAPALADWLGRMTARESAQATRPPIDKV